MFLGLRTVIYPAPDLEAAKAWFTDLLGAGPYFDEPFYVGFNVGGHELGLDPNAPVDDGPVAYWGVADADEAFSVLIAMGAIAHAEVRDVGGDIRVGSVTAPNRSIIGIIENPNFIAPV